MLRVDISRSERTIEIRTSKKNINETKISFFDKWRVGTKNLI